MHFPYYLTAGALRLHPHVVFEALAYTIGFRIYLFLKRTQGDVVETGIRWTVIAAAVFGAAVGSRILFWFEGPAITLAHWREISYLFSGKTIVGGLLGALLAVEITKKIIGVRVATGDLLAVPLCVGMAIGRIGCFLTGLSDDTYGTATSLPWGIDLGDGVERHPVQLYEMTLLIALALLLLRFAKRPHRQGDVFKVFMGAYLVIRLVMDAYKPEVRLLPGLSSIQLACIVGLVYYAPHLYRIFRNERKSAIRAAGA